MASPKTAAALSERIAQTRSVIADRFEPVIERFFAEQAARVGARIERFAGSANQLLPRPAEEDALNAALRPLWLLALDQGWTATAETFGLPAEFSAAAQPVTEALAKGEIRAARIIAATRADLDAGLSEGEQLGLSREEIANGLPAGELKAANLISAAVPSRRKRFKGLKERTAQHFEGYAGTVARTEATWGTNMGSLAAGTASGFPRVKMHDSTDHEPCASRNGRIVSERAASVAADAEHANGRLSFEPVTDEPTSAEALESRSGGVGSAELEDVVENINDLTPDKVLRYDRVAKKPSRALADVQAEMEEQLGNLAEYKELKTAMRAWTRNSDNIRKGSKRLLKAGGPIVDNSPAGRLMRAVSAAPQRTGNLYRGMKIKKGSIDDVAALFQQGATVDLPLSSATTQRSVAKLFNRITKGAPDDLGHIPVMATIQNAQGLEVGAFSTFGEAEVVIGGRFEIISVRKSGGTVNIVLRQIARLP